MQLRALTDVTLENNQSGMAANKSRVFLPCKPLLAPATLVLLLVALAAQPQVAWSQRAQNCSADLGGLMTCAPYAVPGSQGAPSDKCCTAIKGVDRACLCDTLNIISRLPTACQLPSITCPNPPNA